MHTIKKTHKNRLLTTVMSLAIIAGAAGAATGTYAWYSYQKDINVDFTGTTIKADKEIQIGLRWHERLYKMEGNTKVYFDQKYTLGEIEVTSGNKLKSSSDTDSYYIYWIRGNYVTDILKDFQEFIHSAQEELHPITSGKYKPGDIKTGSTVGSWTSFMKTPSHREEEWETTGLCEDYSDYFYLPLAFRVIENQKDINGNDVYATNENIFLSKFTAKDLKVEQLRKDLEGVSEGNYTDEQRNQLSVDLTKAIRVKADYPSHNSKADNFIFNPKADEDKDLTVGGALNLQPDVYYDYVDETKKQIPYGQFENGICWKEASTTAEPNLTYEKCSTFKANNLKGGYELNLGTGLGQTIPSVCKTSKTIVNPNHVIDADQGLRNITATDGYNNVGFVDLSIYLEGWDENIVNYTAGRTFSVEMEFSIK